MKGFKRTIHPRDKVKSCILHTFQRSHPLDEYETDYWQESDLPNTAAEEHLHEAIKSP